MSKEELKKLKEKVEDLQEELEELTDEELEQVVGGEPWLHEVLTVAQETVTMEPRTAQAVPGAHQGVKLAKSWAQAVTLDK